MEETKHECGEVLVPPIDYGNMEGEIFHFECLALKMRFFSMVVSDQRGTFDMAGLSKHRLCQSCAIPLGIISHSLPDPCSGAFYPLSLLLRSVKALGKKNKNCHHR